MKVGLIDVDGHNFPNLALMKISAWHKSQGHNVDWFNGFYEYDKVYMSKVFDFSGDFETCIRAKEIIKGGTGYDLKSKLPDHIEHIYPDYELYGIKNKAYGFLTRGCPRQCKFCIVSEKEGCQSKKVADLSEFWNGQREIVLLDPNITACKEKDELLGQLSESKAYVDFSQGIDARTLNTKIIDQLKSIKLKHVHFALDNSKDTDLIINNLNILKNETGWNRGKVSVYVLVNFDSTIEEDLNRINEIKKLGFNPYVMIFDKKNSKKEVRQLQRYVNNKFIFWSNDCKTFDKYKATVR